MNPIEKAIDDFDTNHNKTIERYQQMIWDAMDNYDLNYCKVLYETALTSNECCDNVDKDYYTLFPEIKKIGETPTIFNPEIVMNIKKENNEYSVKKEIKKWNVSKGLLPNRRVIYRYTIVTRKNTDFWYCSRHNQCFSERPNNSDKVIEQVFGLEFAKEHNKTFECGCSLDDNHMYHYNKAFGKNHKLTVNSTYFQTVEVDNYLNIYYPAIDLYLMINKTSFPITPFYLNKLVYEQKPVEEDYILDINEIDTYYEIDSYNKLIPKNVTEVLEFFERFRNLKAFKPNLEVINEEIISEDEYSCDFEDDTFADSDIETEYLDTPKSSSLHEPLLNKTKTCWEEKEFTIKKCDRLSFDNLDYVEDAEEIINTDDLKHMIKDIVLDVFDKFSEKHDAKVDAIKNELGYVREDMQDLSDDVRKSKKSLNKKIKKIKKIKKVNNDNEESKRQNTVKTGEDCMVA